MGGEEKPVTYLKDTECMDCSQADETSVATIEGVVEAIEHVDGIRLLKPADLWRIIDAAAWDINKDDFILSRVGHVLM